MVNVPTFSSSRSNLPEAKVNIPRLTVMSPPTTDPLPWSLIEKLPCRWISWRDFLKEGSFLSDNSSFDRPDHVFFWKNVDLGTLDLERNGMNSATPWTEHTQPITGLEIWRPLWIWIYGAMQKHSIMQKTFSLTSKLPIVYSSLNNFKTPKFKVSSDSHPIAAKKPVFS